MAVAEIVPGMRVDDFVAGRMLHEGAMGRLFEASGAADFPLLMKVPRFGSADSAEILLAFESEAMILPRLRGQHAPRFVAAGSVATLPYLVMERVAGRSLDHEAKPPWPSPEVARVGAAIADALHAIHAQGVVHLDLKPDNVVLREDGSAVLLDFALAHHELLPDLLAQERRFASGSAPYIAPEQVLGTRSDRRSDLFALGVMLYELATGRLPFGIPRTLAGLRDRLWMDPAPPASHRADVEPWLQEVILRCLEADPARRYQAASHVAFDLRNPAQVKLTERSSRRSRRGWLAQARRWWGARDIASFPGRVREAGAAPVVMVAVDTMHPDDPRQPELQRTLGRILSLGEEFRLICVAVVSAAVGDKVGPGQDAQLEHRIRLRHWLGPLDVHPERVSMHVLEAPDAAAALVEFGRSNNVDLIVLGAPAPEERALAWWRSVASSVTANASCSVHVVRRPGRAREA